LGETRRPEDRDENDSLSAAALEASPIEILMTDEAGRMVLINPAAEVLSGYR
jgi:PAS domain S-box-containing protein